MNTTLPALPALDPRIKNSVGQRIPMKPSEVAAERQKELDRVASLRALDGSALDLDPRDDFVRFQQSGGPRAAGIEVQGWLQETPAASEKERPVLEYGRTSTVHLGDQDRQSIWSGRHDPNLGLWTSTRLLHEAGGLRYEELVLSSSDPAASYKDVWLLTS